MLSIHSHGLCSLILNSKDAIHFQWNISLYVPSAVFFRPALLCLFFMIPPAPQSSQPIVHLTHGVHFLVESQIKYWLQVPSVQWTDNCFPAQCKDEAVYPTWQESVFIFREENEDEQANRLTQTSLLSRPGNSENVCTIFFFFSIKKQAKKTIVGIVKILEYYNQQDKTECLSSDCIILTFAPLFRVC